MPEEAYALSRRDYSSVVDGGRTELVETDASHPDLPPSPLPIRHYSRFGAEEAVEEITFQLPHQIQSTSGSSGVTPPDESEAMRTALYWMHRWPLSVGRSKVADLYTFQLPTSVVDTVMKTRTWNPVTTVARAVERPFKVAAPPFLVCHP